MDFIELIFHVAPDGGSGILEFELLSGFALLVLAFAAIWKKRTKR